MADLLEDFLVLTGVPSLELHEPPHPSPSAAELIAAARDEVLARPGGFDGPVLMATGYGAGTIAVYPARYSWGLAALRGAAGLGLGMLGVKLWLERAGRPLWQLRAPHVEEGGTWDYAAAGAVDPGQTLPETVRREAREELGLAGDDLVGLRPVLLAAGRGAGVAVVFAAELGPEALLRPDAGEVSELCFSSTRTPPGQLCRYAARILPELEGALSVAVSG